MDCRARLFESKEFLDFAQARKESSWTAEKEMFELCRAAGVGSTVAGQLVGSKIPLRPRPQLLTTLAQVTDF